MIVHRLEVVDSTNLRLTEMAREGAPPWTVVLANAQTGGMGRTGRSWWSPPGGLYMSVLIRHEDGIRNPSRLSLLAALALRDAVGEARASIRLKWPNDLLVDGKKLAGILITSAGRGGKVPWAVAGFGVNVKRSNQPEVPAELSGKIACLQDIAPDLSGLDLAENIVRELRGLQVCLHDDGQWAQALKRWSRFADWDAPYRFREGNRDVLGTPVRLSADGGLVLRTGMGEVTVRSGEITEAVQSPESRIRCLTSNS